MEVALRSRTEKKTGRGFGSRWHLRYHISIYTVIYINVYVEVTDTVETKLKREVSKSPRLCKNLNGPISVFTTPDEEFLTLSKRCILLHFYCNNVWICWLVGRLILFSRISYFAIIINIDSNGRNDSFGFDSN